MINERDIKLIISEPLLRTSMGAVETCDMMQHKTVDITQNDLYTKLIGFNINACYSMQMKFLFGAMLMFALNPDVKIHSVKC